MAKWLRCSISNHVRSTRVGSNPVVGATNHKPTVNTLITANLKLKCFIQLKDWSKKKKIPSLAEMGEKYLSLSGEVDLFDFLTNSFCYCELARIATHNICIKSPYTKSPQYKITV